MVLEYTRVNENSEYTLISPRQSRSESKIQDPITDPEDRGARHELYQD